MINIVTFLPFSLASSFLTPAMLPSLPQLHQNIIIQRSFAARKSVAKSLQLNHAFSSQRVSAEDAGRLEIESQIFDAQMRLKDMGSGRGQPYAKNTLPPLTASRLSGFLSAQQSLNFFLMAV